MFVSKTISLFLNKEAKLWFLILLEDIKLKNSEKYNAQLLKEWLTA